MIRLRFREDQKALALAVLLNCMRGCYRLLLAMAFTLFDRR